MGTYRHPHARPFTEEHDLWWVGLILMVVCAAIVVFGLYLGFTFLLSLAEYVPSELLQ